MTTRMLIDARHQEETRVAVVRGNRIEEFDFEAAARKQIKGNIYLAKVTRVEPSLQAAFIDYGGNRHGFLAFSEIHPDYYQIPKEDRDALLREEQRLADDNGHQDEGQPDEEGSDDHGRDNGQAGASENGEGHRPEEHGNSEEAGAEALRRRRMALRRRYKIQEVIRRRQVMLVQVVKEERGNKGAALTTYISLAGRYSVLMPNTPQGGGISRKIANAADRKRLKAIMSDLALPPSMGAIVRTAGLERTKAEIKRDFDYLTRLWDEIRERTLSSSAPALIYEDSDLIKRAIRDIYSREIDEVLVDGAEGHAQAKAFMKLLMPSHARKVQSYADPVPLFLRAGVETQLAQLLNPVVTLKSGGYIVINSTEALVAIDVNSGRSTREYNIEETALKTNIEAAEEVARQLRLRDLAGLVVVDFIDMESNANNRKVERALKEALKLDRARIQVGRISSFGLLEMSRQRLRTGVLEASTRTCPMCEGTGLVRTEGSAALSALRQLEEEAVKGRASMFRLRADRPVAVYMLNRKRAELAALEERYGVTIEVVPDESLIGGRLAVDASGPPPVEAPRWTALAAPARSAPEPEDSEEADEDAQADAAADEVDEDAGGGGRRRRRRRGGRGRDRHDSAEDSALQAERRDRASGECEPSEGHPSDAGGEEGRDGRGRRRRRRRRGGRRDAGEAALLHGNGEEEMPAGEVADDPEAAVEAADASAAVPDGADGGAAREDTGDKPKRPRRRRATAVPAADDAGADVPATEAVAGPADGAAAGPDAEPAAPRPRRTRRRPGAADPTPAREPASGTVPVAVSPAATPPEPEPAPASGLAPEPEPASVPEAADAGAGEGTGEAAAPRRGWWQRTFGT